MMLYCICHWPLSSFYFYFHCHVQFPYIKIIPGESDQIPRRKSPLHSPEVLHGEFKSPRAVKKKKRLVPFTIQESERRAVLDKYPHSCIFVSDFYCAIAKRYISELSETIKKRQLRLIQYFQVNRKMKENSPI